MLVGQECRTGHGMLLSMGSQIIGNNLATEQLFLMILYLCVYMVVVVQLLSHV